MNSNRKLKIGLTFMSVVCGVVLLASQAFAMPPHPSLVEKQNANGASMSVLSDKVKPEGLNEPSDFFSKFLDAKKERMNSSASLAPISGTFKILALLVDFSDNNSQASATFFDSLIYDSVGATIRDYFDEISYGQLDLVTVNLPSGIGWTRAPQTYAYYVDGQRGLYGTYPQNSRGMVGDLVNLVDPVVDFSQYDNDGDGYVDVLLVIHAGTGAELSGSDDDIHSHKWSLPSGGTSKDGVIIYDFTVQPEYWFSAGDMTTGVYVHELCHGFGLPDLYDTDYSSNGIGDWGIMSFGSWNGPGNLGGSPAHPSAWSRIQMGFATAVEVTGNMNNQTITPVASGGSIFRVPIIGGSAGEYFLIENRQQTGYDSYLPSSGLLIWHIDSTKTNNTEEWYPPMATSAHYKVALVQADGNFDIDKKSNTGDIGDPYPGSTGNTSFSAGSSPASDSYSGGSSITAVTNIVNSGQDVIADIFVGVIAAVDDDLSNGLPYNAELGQNYPNPFNPTTNISFSLNRSSQVDLSVYNILGKKVATIIEGEVNAGTTSILWEANDDDGQPLSSGIYFYHLTAGETQVSGKMVLLK